MDQDGVREYGSQHRDGTICIYLRYVFQGAFQTPNLTRPSRSRKLRNGGGSFPSALDGR